MARHYKEHYRKAPGKESGSGQRMGIGRSPGASVLSVAERLVQRGAAVAVTFLLAVIASPELVGVYATALMVLSAYQAISETTIRQIGVSLWNYRGAARFLEKSSAISGIIGMLAVSIVAILLAMSLQSWTTLFKLAPLTAVPLVTSTYLSALSRAQRAQGGWPVIAKSQLIASIASLALAIPFMFVIDFGAASMQMLISEVIFAFLITRFNERPTRSKVRVNFFRAFYLPTALSNTFGWAQSQLERLILVLISTAPQVGSYSLSIAIARSGSDAIISALISVLRARLSSNTEVEVKNKYLRVGLYRGIAAALVLQTLVCFATILVLPPILGPEWKPAIQATIVFSASTVFAAVVWSLSAYLIDAAAANKLLPAQTIGIVLSCGCGYLLSVSLVLGAAACVARDAVAVGMRMWLARAALGWRDVLLIWILGCISVAISVTTLLWSTS
ncbi:lipopolysaccharide biosynthesis protein [Paenarthrobacter nicotinovorans]|uniref:lipopolysaccharide biosynthesis protein n=1 Tax=Paenarthrobacter nicotinovorans TaxID=29320 RepID=UPI003A81309D